MKLWKKLLLGLAVCIGLFILVGFLLPTRAHVERSVVMRAKPEAVFPRIASLKRWPEWTAWTTNRFPDMTLRFKGPDSGVGAVMVAAGKSSGDGKVTITRAEVTKGVGYALDFNHGTQIFQGAITFESVGDDLKVVWSYEAELGANPLKRWAALAFDALMGSDLETGLWNLKRRAEEPR